MMQVKNLFAIKTISTCFFACFLACFLTSCHLETPPNTVNSENEPKTIQTSEQPGEKEPVEKQPVTQQIKENGKPPKSLWTRMSGEDWPTFLGPRRDSKSTETGIIKPWPEKGLKIVWQRKLGIGYGIGSASRGRFFQFERRGDKAVMVCLHAESGKLIWKQDYPTRYVDMYGYNGGPRCSPVVDGDRVYFFGAEGMLHCLRAEDGEVIWKTDTEREFGVIQNFFGVGSTPIVEGDLLLVMVGGSPPESRAIPPGQLDRVEPNGSGLVAFDKTTGKVRYKTLKDLASYASLQTASINGRRLCFAFARAGLAAIEPSNGKVVFEYPWRARILESVNASTPVVVGDEVFISETYGPGSSLLKVHANRYDLVWRDDPRKRDKAMQTHWNTSVYHEGYLYGSSGRHENNAELRCIEWSSGKVMWSIPDLTRSSLMYVDGHFVCLSEDGVLRLIKVNPKKYDLVSELKMVAESAAPQPFDFGPPSLLRSPCWAAPILSHGLLYVRGNDRLVCLELIPS